MKKDRYVITKPKKFIYNKEEKKNAKLRELKPFFKYYAKFKGHLFIITLTFIIIGICSIISPIINGKMIAQFTENFDANYIIYLALQILILSLFSQLINFFNHRLWAFISVNTTYYIVKDLTIRINEITQRSFDNSGAGTFTTRMYGDVSVVGKVPIEIISYITDALSQIGFVTYTFSLNVWVGLFMIGYTIIFIIMEYYRINTNQKNDRVIKKIGEKSNSFINENIRGMKDIRSVNATDNVIEAGLEIAKEKFGYQYARSLKSNNIKSLRGVMVSVLGFAFIALCVYLLVNNQIEIAAFLIAYNYRGRITGFANYIVTIKGFLSECSLSAQRLNDIFDENKYPVEKFGDVTIKDIEGNLDFKNVSFGYNEDSLVLDNISLEFKANQVTALVGLSGAGKSTIVSLISRLYDINDNNGEILLDNTNIKNLTKDCLRENICYISQNPYIYNMSVENNLRLAKHDATEEEIIQALIQANIYEDVCKFKDGIKSILGENGIKVSGGQRQRIAIARAILRDSKIILFDEATSALDNINQAVIKRTIEELSQDHTIIVIAHRLSTVVDADKIIYIKDGKAFAQGTHNQLMESCEEYNSLYKEEDI